MKHPMALIATALTLFAVSAANGQRWTEIGDAGDLPGSAQRPMGVGSLDEIEGVLLSHNDVDMYCIHIHSIQTFMASNCVPPSNTQLWLFQEDGTGVAFRDDFPCGFDPTITGSLVHVVGDYLLAISEADRDGVNMAGLEIWNDYPSGSERAPDGPGAPGPVAQWIGQGYAQQSYWIMLTGVSFCGAHTVVQPTTWSRIKVTFRD